VEGRDGGAWFERAPHPATVAVMHPDHDPPSDAVGAAVARLRDALTPRRDPASSVAGELPSRLPDAGIGEEAALRLLGDVLLAGAAQLQHPGFMAHMDPPTPWVTWITALWTAALNQNLLHDDTGAAARDLEERVIGWLAPHFGMRGGHFTPGSTVANLTALWAAREIAGVRRVVASARAHVSVPKAAAILGLRYETVPADAAHRLDAAELGPVDDAALVLTAGTTVAGAVDPLDAGPTAGWRHVDAAWAGPLRLSARHRSVLDGIETADSVAVSAHKWLFQPKESAIVLFADPERAHRALSFGSGYLARPNIGLLGSHGAAPAAGLAATLLAWGRRGMEDRIDAEMERAHRLATLVASRADFTLWAEPNTGIVVWRPMRHDPAKVRERMRNAFVSLVDVDGERWLRSVATNPNARPEQVVAAAVDACRA
jgi:L-2,4-diaminobutyrate decarboxylase